MTNQCKQTRPMAKRPKATTGSHSALYIVRHKVRSSRKSDGFIYSTTKRRCSGFENAAKLFRVACRGRWKNESRACGTKSLPTCLSCSVKPEKTNVLPTTARENKWKYLICNRLHGNWWSRLWETPVLAAQLPWDTGFQSFVLIRYQDNIEMSHVATF